MRSLFALVLASLSVCACAGQRLYVGGTVDYTATPPIEGASGALPLRALYCTQEVYEPNEASEGVRLDGGCVLNRRFDGPLIAVGECRVRTAKGDVSLAIESASLDSGWRRLGKTGGFVAPVEVVLGGKTPEGQYLTYRFTGTRSTEEATPEECTSVLSRPRS
jgi:hypothetical protein